MLYFAQKNDIGLGFFSLSLSTGSNLKYMFALLDHFREQTQRQRMCSSGQHCCLSICKYMAMGFFEVFCNTEKRIGRGVFITFFDQNMCLHCLTTFVSKLNWWTLLVNIAVSLFARSDKYSDVVTQCLV